MLENKVYDLMMQIVNESKSLYRLKNNYCEDAEGDPECNKIWQDLIYDKESQLKKLMTLLKKQL